MKHFSVLQLDRALGMVTHLRQMNVEGNAFMWKDELLGPSEQSACLDFIEEVLTEAKIDAETVREKAFAKHEPYPYDLLEGYAAKEEPQTITMVLKAFASLSDDPARKMISTVKVNKWLQTHGYIDKVYIDDLEKEDWYPTDQGAQVGIHASKVTSRGQSYMRITYDRDGQLFLAERLEEIENEMLFEVG